VLVGIYRSGEEAHVELGRRSVYVDFVADPGETVGVVVDPEAIVVAPDRFPSSARNVWPGRVRSVDATDPQGGRLRRIVRIHALGRDMPVALTPASVKALRLVPGRRVYLYAKATALRRVHVTRGSPRT
jgi:molybdopterin-binding protein